MFEELDLEVPVNVSKVRHLSPFRYAGGKTWFVPWMRKWLGTLPSRPSCFMEPFAGGAIVGLTVAAEGLADLVILVERDQEVGAVWRTIFTEGRGEELAEMVTGFDLTREKVVDLLEEPGGELMDRAFRTVVRNRAQHGGILAEGASLMRGGENGKGIASRWYPDTIASRIRFLGTLRDRVVVVVGDAFTAMESNIGREGMALFVDPPYSSTGRRLYTHGEINHGRLFDLLERCGVPFLLTYNDDDAIRALCEDHDFEAAKIAMRTRQGAEKTELMISNDLAWAR